MAFLCNKGVHLGLMLTVIFFIGSCGGNNLKVAPISPSENPGELIRQLEKDIADARNNQVNLLAPDWFSKSEDSLKTAREDLARGAKPSEIIDRIAISRAQLLTAEGLSQTSRTELADVVRSRDLARAAGAPALDDDYAGVEKRFLKLTAAVEKDNLKYAAKHRDRVAADYRALELRAIKDNTLAEVRKLLAQAEQRKTYKLAPQTYARAQELLREADEYITENRYEKEEMVKKANRALFHTHRHLQIEQQCQKVADMEPESIVLSMEARLQDISVQLAAPDMRDHSFDIQVENIIGTTKALQYERSAVIENSKSEQALVEDMQMRIAVLEGKPLQELVADKPTQVQIQFESLFETVRAYFEPDEAEVYKNEGQVVIRLKAMDFPVGQSVILPKNYALLSKVRRAVRTFSDADLIIEGHTDSTGSEERNDHVSEMRADAVRQYLVANDTLPYDRIMAVGYGSSKPLVSNKTKKGRAFNRRIDLIITPHFERPAQKNPQG